MQPQREQIDQALANGDTARAKRLLCAFWRYSPQASTARFVLSRSKSLEAHYPAEHRRVAVLRSLTLEPIEPLVRAEALVETQLGLDVRFGEFNAYAQEVLDPQSWLHDFAPDAVILAVQTRDIAPELWHGYAALSAEEESAVIDRVAQELETWIDELRRQFVAAVVVHGLENPPFPAQGVLDANTERSQAAAVERINRRIQSAARNHRGVYFLDYDGLIAREGRLGWYDERKWITVRMPIAASRHIALAREWVAVLAPALGRSAKALVVDLDNTLWAGVVGEDGVSGIRSDEEHPGAFHRALQREMLNLRARGVVLAIASKNNESDALDALRDHPDLLLRPEDFSAIRCNWRDKASNLQEIARELNIGVDSLVFLDDNPAERDQVATALPAVHVLDPVDLPQGLATAVRQCALLQRLSVSTEDRRRHEYYAAQSDRRQARRSSGSLEEFYRSLDQAVSIEECVDAAAIERVAQLTQKTNQFNMTTRRYSSAEIERMAAREDASVLAVRVSDRYGDHGLVGVCILRQDDPDVVIDTFLLSCRVIGRMVEDAVLAHLVERCRADRRRELRGYFAPTPKNAPAADFYPRHGFEQTGESGPLGALWSLQVSQSRHECPEWIRLQTPLQDEARELTNSI